MKFFLKHLTTFFLTERATKMPQKKDRTDWLESEKVYDYQGNLCHEIIRLSQVPSGDYRHDVSHRSEFLQLGVIVGNKSKSFRPHVHLERQTSHERFLAQESWVVLRGQVLVDFYDQLGSRIRSTELRTGDLSITFRGGHGYTLLEDSVVYEFKTGPYLGQEIDKRFID